MVELIKANLLGGRAWRFELFPLVFKDTLSRAIKCVPAGVTCIFALLNKTASYFPW